MLCADLAPPPAVYLIQGGLSFMPSRTPKTDADRVLEALSEFRGEVRSELAEVKDHLTAVDARQDAAVKLRSQERTLLEELRDRQDASEARNDRRFGEVFGQFREGWRKIDEKMDARFATLAESVPADLRQAARSAALEGVEVAHKDAWWTSKTWFGVTVGGVFSALGAGFIAMVSHMTDIAQFLRGMGAGAVAFGAAFVGVITGKAH